MATHILLRWKGRADTIDLHRTIAVTKGAVWWGRWAKNPTGREALVNELRGQLTIGEPTSIYLRTDGSEWRARLTDINPSDFNPPADTVPDYYPPDQTVDMWLQLTDFEPLPLGWSEENLVFAQGPPKGQPVHFRGMNSVYRVADRSNAQPTGTASPEERLGALASEVLRLQTAYDADNTAEMHRRGLIIRDEIPAILNRWLEGTVYDVEGRDGTGAKTRVPWVRAFDPTASPKATDGWYVVYLFAFDGSALYLSLNQGTADFIKGDFRAKPPEVLRARVDAAREHLSAHLNGDESILLDISLNDPGSLGRGYESGNVVARRYDASGMPDDETMREHLLTMLSLLDEVQLAQLVDEPVLPTLNDTDAAWMFQANPATWPIDEWLAGAIPGSTETWTASRYWTEMDAGQPMVLWRSGADGGISAICELTGPATEGPKPDFRGGEPGQTEWRVPIRLVKRIDPPMGREDLKADPVLSGLEVLSFANATNFRLTAEQLEAIMSRVGLSLATTSTPARRGSAPPPNLEDLERDLYMPDGFLRRVATLLEDKLQVIFYGPPGTGKTYVARAFAASFAEDDSNVEIVQFHPSYAYEDFIEGIRPTVEGGGFELIDGPFKRLAERARRERDKRFVLVVDEINRANITRVFGELFYLLEYRDDEITLQYEPESRFSLPRNLFLVATMNTADRSIALLDAALRRRFHFVRFFPDQPPVDGLLRKWLADNAAEFAWVADVLEAANRQLPDSNLAIGPSHFMRAAGLTEEWVELIWEYTILPYLEEQFYGQPDELRRFELKTLRREAGRVTDEDEPEDTEPDEGDANHNAD